jgi:formylmethanofuran dehydrogenase subunit E
VFENLKRDLSYIQGLLDGETGRKDHPDHKALLRLVEATDQLVEAMERLDRRHAELEEYVELIDEDLNDLELLVYEDEEDEDGLVEITCPECGEEVLVDEEDLEDLTLEVLCPNCHTVLEMENTRESDLDELIGEKATSESEHS